MRLRPWLPVLAVLAQLVVLGVAAAAVDAAGLPRRPDEWPFLVGFVLLAVFVAPWPVGATLVTGAVGALARDDDVRRGAGMVGAVLAAAWGCCGTLVGVVWVLTLPHPAERVMGLAVVAASVLTLLPLRPAFRRTT